MADRVVVDRLPSRLSKSESSPVTQKVIGVPTVNPWERLKSSISQEVWGKAHLNTSFSCPIWVHTQFDFDRNFYKNHR